MANEQIIRAVNEIIAFLQERRDRTVPSRIETNTLVGTPDNEGRDKTNEVIRYLADDRAIIPDEVAESEQDNGLTDFNARLTAMERGASAEADDFRPVLLPDDDGFWAKITSSTYANGSGTAHATDPSTKWTYGFAEVYKSATGYGGFATLSGGRTGTAYNTIEDINTTTGADRMGNGVQLNKLDYDSDSTYEFAIRPCPNNVIVWMREVGAAGTKEYWYQYENGTCGSC